jgi:CHAT domain-containing protein/tetratricopeptide (TPR) repeat protein
MRIGGDLFRAGRFRDAAAQFESVAKAGTARHDAFIVARAVGNLGGARFALHEYQPALQSFLKARRLAGLGGDHSAVAALDTNIASLYTEMGDFVAAASWVEGARERLSNAEDRSAHLAELLLQLATVRSRQGRVEDAVALFRKGIRAAANAGDWNLYSIGWNRCGEESLKLHQLDAAEAALLEAYRVRKLHRLPLDSSYRNLGRLKLEQGDLRAASFLLDRAVELAAGKQGPIPTWDLYHYRGRVRLSQGRLSGALDDLRIAVRLGRAWRWSGAADDAGRIGQEGWLGQVYSALIEADNRLYQKTGDRALARESFEALEENRASSLRVLRAGRTANCSSAYWEALLRLQQAEISAIRGGMPAEAAAARAGLARLEAAAPAASPRQGGLLGRAQAALDTDTALLSFSLGNSTSWLWAIDHTGIEVYALPPGKTITDEVQQTVDALREDRASTPEVSAALYRTLFGQLGGRFRNRRHWMLALDGPLFDAPLAALTTRDGKHPAYLVEQHTTQVIPGVGWWLDAVDRPATRHRQLFVGIGDAIYNAADSRADSHRDGALPTLTLPRLVGSGVELDACAGAWQGEHSLLKGADACRRNLQRELMRNPAIVHFAAHIVPADGESASGRIALSRTTGDSQLLTPEEIARWDIPGGLIVLSGCHSAGGPVLSGTGLLGLTRAWLAAGASNVIGSRWDTPDDTGSLFTALYRHLGDRRTGPAEALRAAQLEMLHSGGWRTRPRYWSAYFAMGVEGTK